MPKISVVVPIYNVEDYLPRCVDSILGQTFSDFELFLVDDGSPDNCGKICDEYAKIDERTQVIHKENGGLSDARNVALDRATGEYLAFVDSDDYIASNCLELLYNAAQKHDAKLVVGNMLSVDEEENIKDFYCPHKEETVLKGRDILETLTQPCAVNRLYKTELFKNIRYPAGRLYEDVFVYHKILEQVEKIIFVGQATYYYFLRKGSIMRSEYNVKFADIIEALESRLKWLEKIGAEDYARETRLFIYSRVGVALALLDPTNAEEQARIDIAKRVYADCYESLMSDKKVSTKQKARCWMLRHNPKLHSKLYGKNMPIALG